MQADECDQCEDEKFQKKNKKIKIKKKGREVYGTRSSGVLMYLKPISLVNNNEIEESYLIGSSSF
jgi:hypothetical protein